MISCLVHAPALCCRCAVFALHAIPGHADGECCSETQMLLMSLSCAVAVLGARSDSSLVPMRRKCW